ncbi:hypothetical protein H6A36_13210 [Phocaeicola coprocola]|nr:hypothetical protein [Phocaeicola coprocola]
MRMAEEGKTVYTRYYLGGNYEAHCDSSGTEERLYVGGDCYEAPALLVKKEGKTEIRFLTKMYYFSNITSIRFYKSMFVATVLLLLNLTGCKNEVPDNNLHISYGKALKELVPDTVEIYSAWHLDSGEPIIKIATPIPADGSAVRCNLPSGTYCVRLSKMDSSTWTYFPIESGLKTLIVCKEIIKNEGVISLNAEIIQTPIFNE